MASNPMKSLDDQLACLRRELALRRNVYPKWIESRRMTPDKAAHEIECMEAAIKTIELHIGCRDAAQTFPAIATKP